MTIDSKTGCLVFPNLGASIGKALSRTAFLENPAFSGGTIFKQNEPWCSYRLPELPQGDTQLCIVLQFFGERFGHAWSGGNLFGAGRANLLQAAEMRQ